MERRRQLGVYVYLLLLNMAISIIFISSYWNIASGAFTEVKHLERISKLIEKRHVKNAYR